jgi:hypothetical protein
MAIKYTFSGVTERKIPSINKTLKECIASDETGRVYEKITLWQGDWALVWDNIKSGYTLAGELKETEKNGYKNFTLYPEKTVSEKSYPKRSPVAIKEAMETKNENIKQAQERKQASMEELAAFRDATQLTVAYLGRRQDVMSVDEIQTAWKSWRSWLKDRLNEPF